MKARKTEVKVDGIDTSLLLFALERLQPEFLCPAQREAKQRLIKRLIKADMRIQDMGTLY